MTEADTQDATVSPREVETPLRPVAGSLTFLSALGLLMATALLLERLAILRDPDHIPTCTISPLLSCSSVMDSPQAEAFGIPNPVIGIVGFAAVLTSSIVMLTGARLPRWYWMALCAGATFGVVFVHWLIFQSLYRIGALCPYCMVVWSVTIPTFVLIIAHAARVGALPAGERLGRVLTTYRGAIITGWFVLVIAAISQRFWDYWLTLLT